MKKQKLIKNYLEKYNECEKLKEENKMLVLSSLETFEDIKKQNKLLSQIKFALASSEPYACQLNDQLKESPDFGLQLLVDSFYQILDALKEGEA